ncbi:TPA: hypothetical protein SJ155_001913 [Yersinia enterocolitica]|uniref:hypothetical protein n=1 Tax=Yersinia enterocolitica TaxID=630 RepID=UPI0029AA3C7A|nr:hypothetical protein [Yersinia enterocolitica]EMA9427907.1 hypothetical protein [Yersinia enterocolitica]HDL7801487.1 hypothetical protein [Yersinia enterocolitica]HEI6711738.1 hypothetical protein [Yersinia enterocolitica]HEI6905301.1 hypothetical protein [Yersinia enterocolitica]
MKSEDIFKQILSIDTLLSFNGIIPSLSGFQRKLIAQIEAFCLTLKSEQHPPIEVDRLCHLLCHYLDKRTENTIKDKGLSWDSYLLLDYFYGYSTPAPADNVSLEALLNSDDAVICQYALKILVLSRNLPNRDVKSQQLFAQYGHKLLPPNLVMDNDDLHMEPEPEETGHNEELLEIEPASEPRRIWRSLGLPLFTALLSLGAFWFWCSRYLGDLS